MSRSAGCFVGCRRNFTKDLSETERQKTPGSWYHIQQKQISSVSYMVHMFEFSIFSIPTWIWQLTPIDYSHPSAIDHIEVDSSTVSIQVLGYILNKSHHNSRHWFQIDFLCDFLCLDGFVLVGDENVSGLIESFPTVSLHPEVDSFVVPQIQEFAERVLGNALVLNVNDVAHELSDGFRNRPPDAPGPPWSGVSSRTLWIDTFPEDCGGITCPWWPGGSWGPPTRAGTCRGWNLSGGGWSGPWKGSYRPGRDWTASGWTGTTSTGPDLPPNRSRSRQPKSKDF